MRKWKLVAAAGLVMGVATWVGTVVTPATTRAADHGDAPNIDNDAGADIADVYFFLDPNNNERVILIGTIHGFITPGEAANFGGFDPDLLYRFQFENTGDAKPDLTLDVTFSPRTGSTAPQTATVKLPGKGKDKVFTAPTTPPTLGTTAATQTITTNQANDVRFFAGITDDPFFFDIPGFQRFVGSVLAGHADTTVLQRGRDTFAGYNIMAIAFDLPKSLIRGDPSNNVVGVQMVSLRRSETPTNKGTIKLGGKYRQKDRMGNPAVNTAFLPFGRKSAYNGGTPIDDAKGAFRQDITNTLTALGTDSAHQTAILDVIATRGDYLRLDLTKPNTGSGGGDTPVTSQFPNGRRLQDDVIDILLTLAANGDPTVRPFALGDNANGNDVPFQDTFPFLAPQQLPRDAGVIDDNTRN